MTAQIIKDDTGKPISVLIDYQQWLQIEQLLKQGKVKANAPNNPLDWYTLTETANSILNELIAYSGREEYLELKKEHPDSNRIEALRALFKEIHEINRNPENFKTAKRMEEIINIYGPKLKRINNGEYIA